MKIDSDTHKRIDDLCKQADNCMERMEDLLEEAKDISPFLYKAFARMFEGYNFGRSISYKNQLLEKAIKAMDLNKEMEK